MSGEECIRLAKPVGREAGAARVVKACHGKCKAPPKCHAGAAVATVWGDERVGAQGAFLPEGPSRGEGAWRVEGKQLLPKAVFDVLVCHGSLSPAKANLGSAELKNDGFSYL